MFVLDLVALLVSKSIVLSQSIHPPIPTNKVPSDSYKSITGGSNDNTEK